MNDRALLEKLRRTQTANGRKASRLFRAEGTRLVERALRARVPLDCLVAAESYGKDAESREGQVLEAVKMAEITLHTLPDAQMATLNAGRGTGAIIALLPLPVSDTPLAKPQPNRRSVVLVAADIIDPGNVGAMIRSAHGLGAAHFIAVGRSDPWHPRAVRTSMGSIFRLPVTKIATPDEAIRRLRAAAYAHIGAVSQNGELLTTFSPPSATAIWMGNEYEGLSPQLIAQLDHKVRIPMAADIDSFSVSAATAIMLYAVL